MSTKKTAKVYPVRQYFLPEQSYEQIKYLTSPGIAHAELSPINKRDYDNDKITGEAKYEKNNCKLILAKGQPIGICGRNLLDIALSKLHDNANKNCNYDCPSGVRISLKEFATLSGINIENKIYLDNFRKTINKELEALFNARLSWKAKRDFYDGRIISGKGIIAGYIVINFEQKIANYLQKNFLVSSYDKRLFLTDNRDANLWSIYHKFYEYSHMPNNIKNKKENIISIKSLIAAAIDIPDIETVRIKGRHYRQQIIEPLDNALCKLEEVGWIKFEYCYAKKKKIPVNAKQPCNMSIDEYADLYIKFEILEERQMLQSSGNLDAQKQ